MISEITITALIGILTVGFAAFKFLDNKIEKEQNDQQKIMIALARIEERIIAIEKKMASLERHI